MFRFKCRSCDEWHEGMPHIAMMAPSYYYGVPLADRDTRSRLTSDVCIIDDIYFFVRGCLELPVLGEADPFVWGVWVSLSKESFRQYTDHFDDAKQSHIGPFFAWLASELPLYPSTQLLKTLLHLRDDGIRPRIELESTDHPLSVEQRTGITVDRVAEIYAYHEHQERCDS